MPCCWPCLHSIKFLSREKTQRSSPLVADVDPTDCLQFWDERRETCQASKNEDEAGPYQAIPQPGASWQPEGHPVLQPHEYERGGTAKLLTLFRPTTGEIRAKGVLSVTNAVLHPWLKEQISAVLAEIQQEQPAPPLPPEARRARCAHWETGLGPPPPTPKRPLSTGLRRGNCAGALARKLGGWS